MIDYTGQTIGYMRVIAQKPPKNGKRTKYSVVLLCCNTEKKVTHDQIQKHIGNDAECCVNCYKAKRRFEGEQKKTKRRNYSPRPAQSATEGYRRVNQEVAEAANARRSNTLARIARIAAGQLPTAP